MDTLEPGDNEVEGPSIVKSGTAPRGRNNRPAWRRHKGAKPFDPGSAKAQITLEEYLQRGIRVSENARSHHRRKLSTEERTQKRIDYVSRSVPVHGTKRLRGDASDSVRSTLLGDLQRQEIRILEAFQNKSIGTESAVYLLTENHFVAQLISGPAYHRANLLGTKAGTVRAAASKWVELFRKENAASEEDIAVSEATLCDHHSGKSWYRRA